MGRRNKSYRKDLHQQAYEKLTKMQAFSESKKDAIRSGTEKDRIFSFNTYQTYWKHIKYFIKYVQKEHPECTTLKQAKKYANEWLQSRAEQKNKNGQHLSAWTIQTEAAALNKLFQIDKADPERFQPPRRNRKDIKRSRTDAVRDKHFSVTNNDELIKFCKGTGLRRSGIESIKSEDLMSRDDIEAEIARIKAIPAHQRSNDDKTKLSIYLDTRIFKNPSPDFFIYVKEKGGRKRLSPVVGPNTEEIIYRFKQTKKGEKVWQYVNSNADIHSYRADYATTLYKMYARPINEIPFDTVNNGSGRKYQSDVYVCRKDEAGKKLDRRAMLICSKALGHNRIDVVANNYLRAL